MQLTYHVTKACNLRCRYCYYADFPSPRMSRETALRATEQVLALTRDHLGVTFFGGEPLLCKDLIRDLVPEVRQRCGAADVTVNFKIATNGLLLDGDFLEFCEANAVFISLSIDGDEASQADRIHLDGGGSIAGARAALDLLAERATTFATYSVITPRNAPNVAASMQQLYEWGSRILITALDYSAPWTRRDLDVLGEQYRALGEFYVRETLARRHFYLSAFDSKILAHTRPDGGDDKVCRMGVNQISIAPDGTYFPCIQFVERPEFAVGTVETGIDVDACMALFRQSTGADAGCAGCGIEARCSHHCACVSYQSTGTLNGIPPIVCEHERLLTPIADAVARQLYRKRAPLFISKHYHPDYDMLRALEEILRDSGKERPDATPRRAAHEADLRSGLPVLP